MVKPTNDKAIVGLPLRVALSLISNKGVNTINFVGGFGALAVILVYRYFLTTINL